MQVAPAAAGEEDSWWVADAALDRSNRNTIISGLLDPGPYSKSEDDKIADGLRLVGKLTNAAAEGRGITLTKRTKLHTSTPLQEAYVCHDAALSVSYGKVSCTDRGASPLEVVALLADYDSKCKWRIDGANPSGAVKTGVLERVNNHHWVVYYQFRSPSPSQSREMVWSFVAKRLSDEQYVCVLLPTQHDKAPITADGARAESTRVYRVTKISDSATRLELFMAIDRRNSMTAWTVRNIVIQAALEIARQALYVMQMKEYGEYDRAGEDATMLGQLLMDLTRSLSGPARDSAIGTFFSRTAALRRLRGKVPWLEAMIGGVVENKIRHTKSARGADESARSGLQDGIQSLAVPESKEIAVRASSSFLSVRKLGFMTAPGVVQNQTHSSTESRGHDLVPLEGVTSEHAVEMGRSFALTLLSSTNPEAAVEEWIVKYQALVELDEAEPALFRPFVTCIAKNLFERSTIGMKLRVVIGALISILDMASDVVMIFRFVADDQMRAASATVTFIALNMIMQVLLVSIQNKRKSRHVFLLEVLILVSCLKPGVDAVRVMEGGEKDPLLAFPAIFELAFSKGCELAIEAIPGSVLQCSILIASQKKSGVAIFSLCVSALSAAYIATTLFFDFDTLADRRRKNPWVWGAIPDTGRGSVFALMVLISFFQLTVKVFSIALLATTSAIWLAAWLSLDMVVYLLYKLVRNDFVYFIPGTKGATKYISSFLVRFSIKIIVDFTGILTGRAPTEMGGVYYSFNMIVSHVSCWVVAALYVENHKNNDKETIEASVVYMFIGGLQVCWLITLVLCLSKIKRKYLGSFYSTETSRQNARVRFSLGNDAQKMDIILVLHNDVWAHFKDEVKAYSLANWARWENERPPWFNENFKANTPDDFIPRTSLEALNKKYGGKRRRSSIGGLLVEEGGKMENEDDAQSSSSSSSSLQGEGENAQ